MTFFSAFILGVFLYVVFNVQVIGNGPFCQQEPTLLKRTKFCEEHNLPVHYSNKQKRCYCKNDFNPEPGYIVIWDEGEAFHCYFTLKTRSSALLNPYCFFTERQIS